MSESVNPNRGNPQILIKFDTRPVRSRSPSYLLDRNQIKIRVRRSRSSSCSYTRDRRSTHHNNSRHNSIGYNNQVYLKPNKCLGVFGLSDNVTERQLYDIFCKYGPISKTNIVIDAKTRRSRGFGFIYFNSLKDAVMAKIECSGMKVYGRKIRVDYSIFQRPHTPTPGIYMGTPYKKPYRNYHDSRYDRPRDYYGYGREGGHRSPHRENYFRDRRSPLYTKNKSYYRGSLSRYHSLTRSPIRNKSMK